MSASALSHLALDPVSVQGAASPSPGWSRWLEGEVTIGSRHWCGCSGCGHDWSLYARVPLPLPVASNLSLPHPRVLLQPFHRGLFSWFRLPYPTGPSGWGERFFFNWWSSVPLCRAPHDSPHYLAGSTGSRVQVISRDAFSPCFGATGCFYFCSCEWGTSLSPHIQVTRVMGVLTSPLDWVPCAAGSSPISQKDENSQRLKSQAFPGPPRQGVTAPSHTAWWGHTSRCSPPSFVSTIPPI